MSPRALTLAGLVALGCAAPPRARPAAPPPVAAAATPDASPPAVVDASPPAAVDAAPPTPEARERAAGAAVFMRVCGPCHVAMWRVPQGGTLSPASRSEAAVRRLIRAGSGPGSARRMPPIGVDVLPERELPALFAWLRETRVVDSP